MWKKEYKKKGFYFGLDPHPVLKKFLPIIPKGVALDIGAGEGRNSFFLAKNGFSVEAIDKISEGLEKIEKFSKENKLSIKTKKCDVVNFLFKKEKYSLIVASASLDFLRKSQIIKIAEKIKTSLKKGGIVFLGVFSIKDDLFYKIKEIGIKETEENTFFLKKMDTFRHFFTKEELKEMFKDFEMIYLNQKRIEDKSHGEPHFHNVINMVAKKKRK
ncbi:MAG: methyltransferase domain-containing protein [Candidatus Pacebacteria bacterium]|nr:methyltransferase domain-containing protein [Candidatus Paceibacterota bacterium]